MNKVSKSKLKKLDMATKSKLIRAAWEDYVPFEDIEKNFGFSEDEVISLMRKELKPSSFRHWRKRMNGNPTKHKKLLDYKIRKDLGLE